MRLIKADGPEWRLVPVRFDSNATLLVLAMVFLAWAGLLWREWHGSPPSFAPPSDTWGWAVVADYGLGLALGAVAMMGPLAIPAARHVARSSFRSRRTEAVVIFVASFAVVWVLFGLAASAGLGLLSSWRWPAVNVSLLTALAAAAGWQFLSWKRIALRDCHRAVPLPPRGWAARRGDLTFGAVFGMRCVRTCGGMMLPMFAASQGHLLLGMLATAAALGERRFHLLRRRRWLVSIGVVVAGLVVGLPGAGSQVPILRWICAIPEN